MAAWATLLVAYLVLRLVLVTAGTTFEAPDSAVYRVDPGRHHGPLVSLSGQAPRPWGLPAFYALFGSDEARVWAQWALATVAWGALAWEAAAHLRVREARLTVAAGLLLFACLGEVASWDLAILTESVSISLGVVVLTLLLRWLRTASVLPLAGLTVVAVWWTFVRPDIRVFTVTLAVLLAGVAAGRAWRRRAHNVAERRVRRMVETQAGERGVHRWPGRWRSARLTGQHEASAGGDRGTGDAGGHGVWAVVSAAVLVAAVGWYAAIAPGMQRAMVAYDLTALRPDPLPPAEAARVFRLRVDVAPDPRLWDTFRTELGMPACPEWEALRGEPGWREQEWARAYTHCPELVAWMRVRAEENFWTGLARADPWLFLRTFAAQVSRTLGGEQYARVGRAVPAPVERIAFPSRRYGAPVAVAYFAAALALAVGTGAHRRVAWHGGRRRLFWAAVGLAAVAAGSAAATVAVHTGELGRYGVQEAYATRVAVILLIGCALDAYLTRRRQLDIGSHASPSSSSRLSSTRYGGHT